MIPSENCLKVIRKYESFRDLAYKCPAGVWTYGYGFTRTPEGSPVRPGDFIAKDDAEYLLVKKVHMFAKEVENILVGISINQSELDALTSFVFNIGTTKFLGSSIFRVIKQGKANDPEMTDLFMRWVFAAGKPLAGLVKRRLTESHLYRTGEAVFDWEPDMVKTYMEKARRV